LTESFFTFGPVHAQRSYIYLSSVILLIATGHILAVYVRNGKGTAWIWPALFYGIWMLATVVCLVPNNEYKRLFRRAAFHFSLIIPIMFAAIALVGIFIPNIGLLKWDALLLMNVVICLVNPFIEELYWRVLPSKYLANKFISYLVASLGFAIGHPLILGVNSAGAAGWPTLMGAFVLGSCWWLYYHKRNSISWPVFTHFLIDLFGLAAYLLANKVPLLL
jgi:membrane protease YdiL (CAAX protease family)